MLDGVGVGFMEFALVEDVTWAMGSRSKAGIGEDNSGFGEDNSTFGEGNSGFGGAASGFAGATREADRVDLRFVSGW